MQRRRFIGAVGMLGIVGMAGCLGDRDGNGDSDGDGENTGDSNGNGDGEEATDSEVDVEEPDEYPDDVENTPGEETGKTDRNGYDMYAVGGTEVPLAPIDDEEVRIAGAVFSPAPDGLPEDDPLDALTEDTRIVTYCPCPHTLSTNRAASLIENGYTDVYALKEGIREWVDRGYPLEGTEVN
ncbi:hypothetical protein BRC65_06670 [Halobacteriales archaeon QH_2_65_14]|nr:MAG: hypothetical protein BRC65_06670 [Halobacteriales archaeon QH_2_65_14]